ncbi:hypothetical protein [Neomoorella glycerini]|uniref:hypothetical protein n=1 Tax=Neomoorella glycerini TaxID=55779 RepID=UPI0012E210D4|nr:hypothetical protein [Moorella glycerini]
MFTTANMARAVVGILGLLFAGTEFASIDFWGNKISGIQAAPVTLEGGEGY